MAPRLLAAIGAAVAHFVGVVEKDASVLVHFPGEVWAELSDAFTEATAKLKGKPDRLTAAIGDALTRTVRQVTAPGGVAAVQFEAGVASELQAAHSELAAPVATTLIPPPSGEGPPPSSLV